VEESRNRLRPPILIPRQPGAKYIVEVHLHVTGAVAENEGARLMIVALWNTALSLALLDKFDDEAIVRINFRLFRPQNSLDPIEHR
jgi:hypothetical protein